MLLRKRLTTGRVGGAWYVAGGGGWNGSALPPRRHWQAAGLVSLAASTCTGMPPQAADPSSSSSASLVLHFDLNKTLLAVDEVRRLLPYWVAWGWRSNHY